MAPLLRFFLRADGTLAAFNGTGPTRRALLERVLAATREAGAAPSNARYCGYQRLAAGDVVLLADTGAIPPRAFAGRAHAAPLAFELSDGSGPIVVNCGAAPEGTPPELAMALRGTAAHSTLIVAEVSMAPLRHERQDARGRARLVPDGGPERVDVERHARDGRIVVQAAHDGWRRRFGLVHARTLALEADGSALSGRDSLTGPGAGAGQPFAIRFHLHPAIKTSVSPSGRAVVLTAADGTIWRFGVREEVELAVEESLFVEPQGRVARTCQIRLSADVATQPVVCWRFERLLAGQPAAADAPAYVPPVDGSDF